MAARRPAGGAIRVVPAEEPSGWVAFFRTDPAAAAAAVPVGVADRFAPETAFRECEEIVGAGRQQVRVVWTNVGAFHAGLWTFTMTEAWAWNRAAAGLVGHRSASPWDGEPRRPGHADERRAWRRELLGNEIRAVLRPGVTEGEIEAAAERLLSLAARLSWSRGKYS